MADVGKDNQESKTVQLTINQLYDNKSLFSKVVSLMNSNRPYSFIVSFLESRGYAFSIASLSNLKKRIEKSRLSGEPLDQVMQDGRMKTEVSKIDKRKVVGYTGDSTDINVADVPSGVMKDAKNTFYSTNQILETILDKGLKTLNEMDYIDPKITLTALTEYNRNNKETNGLSLTALALYQQYMNAKVAAMGEVLATFVPEDQQEEATQALQDLQDQHIKELELNDEDGKLLKALKDSGLPL